MFKVRYFICVLFFICYTAYSQEISPPSNDNPEYLSQLEIIVTDLYSLLDQSDHSRLYYKAYEQLRKEMDKGTIYFTFNPAINETIRGGAMFSVVENKANKITLGWRLIDLYKDHPSIVLSILIHEIWHFYDHHRQPEYFENMKNVPMEEDLYEKDATWIEGMFIDEVLVPQGYELTEFEKYLLSSYRDDKLSSFMIVLNMTDSYVLDRFSELRTEYYRTRDIEKYYKGIFSVGDEVYEYYKRRYKKSDDFNDYCILVSMNTYLIYSARLIEAASSSEGIIMTWEKFFQQYPEYNTLYYDMLDIVKPNIDFINMKYEKLQEYFKL